MPLMLSGLSIVGKSITNRGFEVVKVRGLGSGLDWEVCEVGFCLGCSG